MLCLDFLSPHAHRPYRIRELAKLYLESPLAECDVDYLLKKQNAEVHRMRSPGQNGCRLPGSLVTTSPSPAAGVKTLQYQSPALIAQAPLALNTLAMDYIAWWGRSIWILATYYIVGHLRYRRSVTMTSYVTPTISESEWALTVVWWPGPSEPGPFVKPSS